MHGLIMIPVVFSTAFYLLALVVGAGLVRAVNDSRKGPVLLGACLIVAVAACELWLGGLVVVIWSKLFPFYTTLITTLILAMICSALGSKVDVKAA